MTVVVAVAKAVLVVVGGSTVVAVTVLSTVSVITTVTKPVISVDTVSIAVVVAEAVAVSVETGAEVMRHVQALLISLAANEDIHGGICMLTRFWLTGAGVTVAVIVVTVSVTGGATWTEVTSSVVVSVV